MIILYHNSIRSRGVTMILGWYGLLPLVYLYAKEQLLIVGSSTSYVAQAFSEKTHHPIPTVVSTGTNVGTRDVFNAMVMEKISQKFEAYGDKRGRYKQMRHKEKVSKK